MDILCIMFSWCNKKYEICEQSLIYVPAEGYMICLIYIKNMLGCPECELIGHETLDAFTHRLKWDQGKLGLREGPTVKWCQS